MMPRIYITPSQASRYTSAKSKFTSNDSQLHTGLKLYGILISAWTWNDKQFASSFDTNFIVWYNAQF